MSAWNQEGWANHCSCYITGQLKKWRKNAICCLLHKYTHTHLQTSTTILITKLNLSVTNVNSDENQHGGWRFRSAAKWSSVFHVHQMRINELLGKIKCSDVCVCTAYLRCTFPRSRRLVQLAESSGLTASPCAALLHLRQRLRQAWLRHRLHFLQSLRQELEMNLHHSQKTAAQYLRGERRKSTRWSSHSSVFKRICLALFTDQILNKMKPPSKMNVLTLRLRLVLCAENE